MHRREPHLQPAFILIKGPRDSGRTTAAVAYGSMFKSLHMPYTIYDEQEICQRNRITRDEFVLLVEDNVQVKGPAWSTIVVVEPDFDTRLFQQHPPNFTVRTRRGSK